MRIFTLLLLLMGQFHVNSLEICGYPLNVYCARKGDDDYTTIIFRENYYNTTKFSWPDMGLINMMHQRVLDFDNIREIDFSNNCQWAFSWKMSLEWTALSLRQIRFSNECAHWGRVYGYCVNVPNQWRLRLRVINAELCSFDGEQHRNWVESTVDEDETNDSEENFMEMRRTEVRAPRNLKGFDSQNSWPSLPEVVENNVDTVVVSDENEIEAQSGSLETYDVDELASREQTHREEIEQLRISYEAQIDLLRHQLDVCRSTVHTLSTQQRPRRRCGNRQETVLHPQSHMSLHTRSELQQLQSSLADITAKVSRLLSN